MNFDTSLPEITPAHDVVGVLRYAVPKIARIRVGRDALATGRVPLGHQTLFRSPAADVGDRLSVNEGASPSDLGRELALVFTTAERDLTGWAIEELCARGIDPDDAATTLERHIVWELCAEVSDTEISAINHTQL